MSFTAAQLVTKISTEGMGQAQADINTMSGAVDKAGGFLKTALVGASVAAGAAVVGLGVQSVKMAGDFQEGMTSLVTGAGESERNLKLVSDGILSLATQTGTATQDLTAGMYMIESAGFHGKTGLDVLAAASRGAKVGAASLADVANGVTTAMADYAKSGLTASQATNTLIATVAAGKTHMGDLANAMSTILPTAASVGVSFTDVSGAMATMTGEGTDAASASTYLRQMLMALENPASKGADALKSIGLTSKQVSDDMKKSLPDTLALITDHLKRKFPEGSAAYVAALSDIAGGTKQMQGMLELTGDHLKTFAGNVSGIGDAVKKGGNDITGWNKVTEDFNFKMSQAKEVIETLGIKIGTALLPMVGKLFDVISPLLTGFSNWLDKTNALKNGMDFLSNAFDQIGAAFTTVTTPIKAAHAALAPLTDTFDRATGFIKKTVQATQPLTDTFDRASGFIKKTVQAAQPLTDTFDRASGILKQTHQAAQPLLDTFDRAPHILKSTHDAVKPVVDVFAKIDFKPLASAFKDLFSSVQGAGKAFGPVGASLKSIDWHAIVQGGVILFSTAIRGIALAIQFVAPYVAQIIKAAIEFGEAVAQRLAPIIANFLKEWNASWPVTSAILKGVWDEIVGIIKIAWAIVSGIIKIGLDLLSGNWKQAWNDLLDMLGGVWDGIKQYITGGLEIINTLFGGLPAKALKWGEDMINGFIHGIQNMLGNLGNAAANVGKTIASFLHFSKPDMGPLADADQWMPDMMDTLSKGMNDHIGKVKAAAGNVSLNIAGTLQTSAPPTSAISSTFAQSVSSQQSSAPQATNTPVLLQIDSQTIGRVIMPIIVNQVRNRVAVTF